MSKLDIKKILEDDFNWLKQMSVKEYTLWQNFIQLKSLKLTNKEKSLIYKIKKDLWFPKNDNYLDIDPEIVHVKSKSQRQIWNVLRWFVSSANWSQNPGRFLCFYILDKKTKKFLGIISLGSDFISIGGRDEFIGWEREQRLSGMLKHTLMGSSIVPTQPLGFNYLGGKFISLLVGSDFIENIINNKYKEKLAGITTTSLYGGYSQYNRLKYWKKCKSTEGSIPLEPSLDIYKKVYNEYKTINPEFIKETTDSGKSRPKNRILNKIYKDYGVKPPVNNFKRGVYFCSLYKNTREFLSGRDKKLKEKMFDNRITSLTELWKDKYATKRITNLIKQNRVNNDILYYDDILKLNWEETKERYLNE